MAPNNPVLMPRGGHNVVLTDYTVQFVPDDMEQRTLRNYITGESDRAAPDPDW